MGLGKEMTIDRAPRLGVTAQASLVGLLIACAPLSALGQGSDQSFSVLRFQPAASPLNYFVTEHGSTLPHLTPSVGLILHYDHLPLRLVSGSNSATRQQLIEYQMNADLSAAIGLWDRFELGFTLPLTLTQSSEGLTGVRANSRGSLSGGVGDLRIIPKARIVTIKRIVSLGVSLPLSVPTGNEANFLSEGGVVFAPTAIVGLDVDRVRAAFNIGYRIRPDRSFSIGRAQGNISIDDQVLASLGLGVRLWRGKRTQIEAIGDASLTLAATELNSEEVSGEVIGGVRFHLPLGFVANVGAGPGFGGGIGTPAFRVLAGLGYKYLTATQPPPEAPPLVKTIGDRDGDGLKDPDDKCPTKPEDKDAFEDGDGCPDLDNDKDSIVDTSDRCPLIPEDHDNFDDADGCPDPDNDKDGLTDAEDTCPLRPEDKDGFEDKDGCPDIDNDRDGILDAKDKCPLKAEIFNGIADHDGCPDKSKGPVQIVGRSITVPRVYFATNKDIILKRSFPVLVEVATILKANLWIKSVTIEGHTDSRGDDNFNLDLSRRRAASTKKFLHEMGGVAANRLDSRGFGEARPIADNRTKRGRADNRRVEFVISGPSRTEASSE